MVHASVQAISADPADLVATVTALLVKTKDTKLLSWCMVMFTVIAAVGVRNVATGCGL